MGSKDSFDDAGGKKWDEKGKGRKRRRRRREELEGGEITSTSLSVMRRATVKHSHR